MDPVLPEDTVTIHIPLCWGTGLNDPDSEEDVFIVDGWVPLVSWS